MAISLSGKAQEKFNLGARLDSIIKGTAWHGTLEVNLDFTSLKRVNNYDSIAYYFDEHKSHLVEGRLGTKNWGQPESLFDKGIFNIRTVIRSLPTAERTTKGLTNSIKQVFATASFDEKFGALAYIGGALEMHYGVGEPKYDDLVTRMVAYRNGEDKEPIKGGDCRRYSFLTAKIAAEGMNLPASVIGVRNHSIAQVINQDLIALLDYGSIITYLDTELLRNKDDVDAVLARWTERLTVSDLTMDPIKNIVSYENRYNNFAGFWKKLRNEDNTLRQRSFLMNDRNLELFPQISAKGLISGDIRRGNIGLQGYWLRENNRYSRFLDGVIGANLAAYFPISHTGNSGLSNIFFTDLGLYRTAMYLGYSYWKTTDYSSEKKATIFNFKGSFEDYLKYDFSSNWTLGLITKVGFDQELTRQGEGNPQWWRGIQVASDKNYLLDGYILTSPFISFVVSQSASQTYLTIGTEITDYLSMPNLGQISCLPWFQIGFKKVNFDTSLRGEFQPGSKRFDAISSLRIGSSLLKLKVFYENFTPEFKKYTLFQDVLGAEAEIAKGLGRYQVFFDVSGKQENTGKGEIDLNLGFRF